MIDALLLDSAQSEGGIDLVAKSPRLGVRVDILPIYELGAADLTRYRGLLIGKHADQRFLASRRRQLEAFLAGGGTIVVCGHIGHPFLAELSPYRPIPDYRVGDLEVRREREHPVWNGVHPMDLTWRRRVAGFYGRGANPPPPGAVVIHSLGPQRYPVDFEARPGVGGRLLVHAGADLWVYLEERNSSARIMPQLLDWIAAGGGAP